MNDIVKYSPAILLGGTVAALGLKLWKETFSKSTDGDSKDWRTEEEEGVVFFPEEVTRQNDRLRKLVSRVSRTEKSLDLCLYMMTLKSMADAVITLKQTGVRVRLIVEVSNIGCRGCQVERMMRSGVRVVVRNQTGLMHNKFIIIDDSLVMTGSFNWTRQAVENNNENVVITSSPAIVRPFQEEFSKLWSENSLYSSPAGASEDSWY